MTVSIKNKKVFITGGAGFIGSTLIGRLIENNKITVYGNGRSAEKIVVTLVNPKSKR